ncbi:MAG: hypothetical protein GTO02_17670, partial [Candidatus Dadabacteria bacterium]|nr:hypothetical protein [Candidatus Dadabacteria bacterium]
GATYKHRNVGGIGHIGCFSFFSNKVITTGEGGMVTTGDTNLASKIRILRDHGMSNDRKYWHEIAGFNYRMTNLQAAVGVAQMERFDKFLARRREIGKLYIDGLKDIPGLIMPPKEEWANTIFWIFSILIDDKVFGLSRDNLIKILATQGIETRPFFYPLNEQPPYHQRGNFDISIKLSAQGISLPSGNN